MDYPTPGPMVSPTVSLTVSPSTSPDVPAIDPATGVAPKPPEGGYGPVDDVPAGSYPPSH
ncbi:hypothetical protein [Synechococcus sp. KORDI-100]|uniref:hypothetical protein n=1 Tax=Synechococcus sp. KORDI-100 TaxID=1280380 RepID=UPI00056F2B95|nr:hypothetical protein [Synechococcus sp. KORDI-100]